MINRKFTQLFVKEKSRMCWKADDIKQGRMKVYVGIVQYLLCEGAIFSLKG